MMHKALQCAGKSLDGSHTNGQTKATRADWLNAARDILVSEGVGEVKILTLSHRLSVSRSSFYWYFENRQDLLDHLLDEWEARNTRSILDRTRQSAGSINAALCNFFQCFVDPRLFDSGLDFAVREWARRDRTVRKRIDAADHARLEAIQAMFARHGYASDEADTRARILYFMQLGYHALDVYEPMEERLKRVAGYLHGFTGVEPRPDEIAEFRAFTERIET